MNNGSLSDTFFTVFLLSAIFSALLYTNGAMLPSGGLFNAVNSSHHPDASKINATTGFFGTYKNQKDLDRPSAEKDVFLIISLFSTVLFFLLFVIVEFVIGR